ncbi:MAG: hypothetical protein HZB55_11030 [Deltaproteobacteria bacterium]|nr:hypothetical protein [Deltaproteobacteria bacterium]
MRRLLFLILLALCCSGPAVGSPAPLPVRAVERAAVEPFPGGGAVPAYRQGAGAPGAVVSPEDLAFDAATALGPGVRRVLDEVGDDPRAAYRWVRDRVEFEPYHGVKRGAEGVAWERVGNDFDQAALLAALLRSQAVPCRFVYGVVRVPAPRFAAWYGMATDEEAYRLAVRGGVPIRAIRVGGRVQALEVNHCWLEACLPYGNPGYRGEGERVWIPLDPSYKAHEVALGIDLFPRLGFQEEEFLADYLATPHGVSPEQYVREVLRGKLLELGAAGGLSQAAYRITVVPEGPGELPTDLSPDLETLGVVWERASVPEVYQYRLRFTLWDGVDDGRGVTPGDLRVEIPTAVLARGPLTLVYRPASAEDQALIDGSPTRSPRDPTIGGRLRWRPVLLVDGRPVGEVFPGELTEAGAPGPVEGGNVGTSQTLLVETLYAGRDPAAVDQPPEVPGTQFGYAQARLVVGEAYALAVEMGLVTAEQMAHRAAALRAQQEQGDAETVLAATLSVSALQYLHRTGLAARSLGRLLGVRVLQEPSLVLCGVHEGAGDPFFDAIGLVSAVVSRDGRGDRERAFLFLWGLESSYQEHKVLEDVYRTSAVSTVRILKRCRELGMPPVLLDRSTVDAEAWRLLQLGPEGERIRSDVMEGKKVLLAPEPLTLEGWSGTGYLVWDPATWYAGYMIRGQRAGGNLSGSTPMFLYGLWHDQSVGSDFVVLHTLWFDPEMPGDAVADVVLIDLASAAGPVLAAALVLPDGFPLDPASTVSGQSRGEFRILPSQFVVDDTTTLRAAGLWVDPDTPDEASLRWAVLGRPEDPSPGMLVSQIRWSEWDGSSWEHVVDAPIVNRDPPSAGTWARLRADVTSMGGELRTGYAALVGLWSPYDFARSVPFTDSGTALFRGPPNAAGSTAHAPNEEGELRVPFDQIASWSLDDGYTTVGIVAEGKVIGYDLRSIIQPGVYLLLFTDKTGATRKVNVIVGGIDLAIDADNDNGFGTDFDVDDEIWGRLPPDADHPGKIIGVSDGDADGDGIPDYADWYNEGDPGSSGDDETHRFVPILVTLDIGSFQNTSIDKCKIKFAYGTEADAERSPNDQVDNTTEPRSLRDPPPIRVWTADGATRRSGDLLRPTPGAYVPRAEECTTCQGFYVSPHTQYPLEMFFKAGPGAPNARIFYVEALKGSQAVGDIALRVELAIDAQLPAPPASSSVASASASDDPTTRIAARSVAAPQPTVPPKSTLDAVKHLTSLSVQMIPDYNRDGKIDEKDAWNPWRLRPWRFWINDDHDDVADWGTGMIGDGSIPNDLPGQRDNDLDTKVNGFRDLIDFFPLYLNLNGALNLLPPEKGYTYRLRHADDAIGVLEPIAQSAHGLHTLSRSAPYLYLRDLDISTSLLLHEVRVVSRFGIQISGNFLQGIRDTGSETGIILIEGRDASSKPLLLDILKKGAIKPVQTFPFPLEIAGVEEMFGHRNMRSVAGGAGGRSDRYVDDQHIDMAPPKMPFCMGGTNKALVWMHGYNVDGDHAAATYAEVFKRLFHSGFQGRFYGVSWFGDPPDGVPLLPPTHYHQAVINAAATAKPYADFVKSLVGEVHLAAHSLGNMVVGLAIQENDLTNFASYFAIDASVALEAYGQVSAVENLIRNDGSLNPNERSACMVNVEGWTNHEKWTTYIAGGQSRLLPSEWYKLFPAPDNRKDLTWRHRLWRVPSAKVYNFYSSTEEVLRSYTDDDILHNGSGPLQAYAWVKQEKFKGRRIMGLPVDVGGASSNYCGWRFSFAWRRKDGNGVVRWPTPAEAAAEIDKPGGIDLREQPFFELDNRIYASDGSVIPQAPHLVNLVKAQNGVSPSDFVAKKISETELKNYYKDNQPAHALVSVKDWLLAEAFPATTLPAGANRNVMLFPENSVDMSQKAPNGCMTDPGKWPRKEGNNVPVWWHSDYKDVSYQHTCAFYDKISTFIAAER